MHFFLFLPPPAFSQGRNFPLQIAFSAIASSSSCDDDDGGGESLHTTGHRSRQTKKFSQIVVFASESEKERLGVDNVSLKVRGVSPV